MTITYTVALTLAVTLATWSQPQPDLADGYIGLYGSWPLVRANAEYRGYDLDGYRCGGSLMSPASLGKTFWIRLYDGSWWGPCLSVDCSARKDFFANTVVRSEVAEVDDGSMRVLGARWRQWGTVYVGPCPPVADRDMRGMEFRPSIEFDRIDPHATLSYASAWWPFPQQAGACEW